MRFLRSARLWSILAVVAALLLVVSTASAHERRDVGKYQFTVGFIAEPAFEGQKNGLDLRVVNKETRKPVEGLEKTIRWEITYVSSGASRTQNLRTVFGEPGRYTSDFMPTAPGIYRFRLFGAIEGNDVNETFVSAGGGGGFNDVQPSAGLLFPEQPPSVREINQRASSASTLAIVGIALGAIGVGFGVVSLAAARRKR